MALCPCNQRGEITANRIGEIQCNTESEAQHIARTCLGSLTLVRSQVDANGIRCESRLIDPEAILKAKQLPLKLQTGVLLTTDGAIRYEMTNAALLEVQLDATHLRIQKVIENVVCEIQFIKISGRFQCIGGATLFLHSETDGDPTTATLECAKASFINRPARNPIFLESENPTRPKPELFR